MLISLQVIPMVAVMILLVKTKSKEDNTSLQACIISRVSVQPLGGGSLGPKAEAGEQI